MDEAIIRNVQIDLITGKYNPIDDWFKTIWSELDRKCVNVHHDRSPDDVAFYRYNSNRKKEFIFYYETETKILRCNYKKYWNALKAEFNLEYDSVRRITKILFDHYNSAESRPVISGAVEGAVIEDTLDE